MAWWRSSAVVSCTSARARARERESASSSTVSRALISTPVANTSQPSCAGVSPWTLSGPLITNVQRPPAKIVTVRLNGSG